MSNKNHNIAVTLNILLIFLMSYCFGGLKGLGIAAVFIYLFQIVF